MVDSTNPRIMADNIKMLAAGSGGSSVVANPEGEATEDLAKLEVDGTVYGIPEIEVNPEGAATTDLEKLKVGDTTYAIPVPVTLPFVYYESTVTFSSGEAFIKDKDGGDLVVGDIAFVTMLTETSNRIVFNVYIDTGKLKARTINGNTNATYSANAGLKIGILYMKKTTS